MSILENSKNQTKDEMLNARVTPKVKSILMRLGRSSNTSISEVLGNIVLEYYNEHFPDKTLIEYEKNIFGRHKSGKYDLSTNVRRELDAIYSKKLRNH